jgi:hypothetical protein
MTAVQREQLDTARSALTVWIEDNADRLTSDDLDFLVGRVVHRIDDALAE